MRAQKKKAQATIGRHVNHGPLSVSSWPAVPIDALRNLRSLIFLGGLGRQEQNPQSISQLDALGPSHVGKLAASLPFDSTPARASATTLVARQKSLVLQQPESWRSGVAYLAGWIGPSHRFGLVQTSHRRPMVPSNRKIYIRLCKEKVVRRARGRGIGSAFPSRNSPPATRTSSRDPRRIQ